MRTGTDCGGWLDRADVAAAVGFAYGEGRQFADAIEWLNRALRSDTGDCPIRAAEQSANFEVRQAAQEWSELSRRCRKRPGAARLREMRERQRALAARIEAAITELDNINRRASTPDRLGLLGSACKRLASVETDREPRLAALLAMAQYYRSAYDLAWPGRQLRLQQLGRRLPAAGEQGPGLGEGRLAPGAIDMCERQAQATLALSEEDPSLWR